MVKTTAHDPIVSEEYSIVHEVFSSPSNRLLTTSSPFESVSCLPCITVVPLNIKSYVMLPRETLPGALKSNAADFNVGRETLLFLVSMNALVKFKSIFFKLEKLSLKE